MRLLLLCLIISCSFSCQVLPTSKFDKTGKATMSYHFKIDNCSATNTAFLIGSLEQRIEESDIPVKIKEVSLGTEGMKIDIISLDNQDAFLDLLTKESKIGIWHLYQMTDTKGIEILKALKKDTSQVFTSEFFNVNPSTPSIFGLAAEKDKEIIMKTVEAISASNSFDVRWFWGKSDRHLEDGFYDLYAVKNTSTGKPQIDETGFTEAKALINSSGVPGLSLGMDQPTAMNWTKMTIIAAKQEAPIAFTINDFVVSAPFVSKAIYGVRCNITGYYTLEEYEKFIEQLNLPKLTCRLEFASATEVK